MRSQNGLLILVPVVSLAAPTPGSAREAAYSRSPRFAEHRRAVQLEVSSDALAQFCSIFSSLYFFSAGFSLFSFSLFSFSPFRAAPLRRKRARRTVVLGFIVALSSAVSVTLRNRREASVKRHFLEPLFSWMMDKLAVKCGTSAASIGVDGHSSAEYAGGSGSLNPWPLYTRMAPETASVL